MKIRHYFRHLYSNAKIGDAANAIVTHIKFADSYKTRVLDSKERLSQQVAVVMTDVEYKHRLYIDLWLVRIDLEWTSLVLGDAPAID